MVTRSRAKSSEITSKTNPNGVVWLGPHDEEELGWVLRHVRAEHPVMILDSPGLLHTFAAQLHPTHVILPTLSRDDSHIDQFHLSDQIWPQAKKVVLLGSWWQGYYRTCPIDERWDRFYWYQWWDGLSLWLKDASFDLTTSPNWSPKCQKATQQRVPRKREADRRAVLVVVDEQDRRMMWKDCLTTAGWLPIFRRSDGPYPDCDWVSIIFDLSPCPAEEIAKCKVLLGHTPILAVTGFPRWEDWRALEEAGASCIVGGIFGMAGILERFIDLHSVPL